MKISKLFHWLYCAVMMLPLFVLPIFALAVRSDNNFSPITLTVDSTETTYNLEYNYLFNTNDVEDSSDVVLNNIYYYDDVVMAYGTPNYSFSLQLFTFEQQWFDYDSVTNIDNDLSDADISNLSLGGVILIHYPNSNYIDLKVNFNGAYSTLRYNNFDFDYSNVNFRVISGLNDFKNYWFNWAGLELYSSDYNIISSANVVTESTGTTVTYNDTDFGSQTIYTLYKEVDTYFNYDNVFNFGDLYVWLNTNFFSGNAPLGFFIFWHLLIYWLLTSLLWLLFDVLMYVPQLIHRWLDKASLS